jgi:RES domain-containing protein
VSPVLRVPSAVVPLEHNYLLNPRHPQFGSIRRGEPMPFPIDLRLR